MQGGVEPGELAVDATVGGSVVSSDFDTQPGALPPVLDGRGPTLSRKRSEQKETKETKVLDPGN